MDIEKINKKIEECLNKIYKKDSLLFKRNFKRGLCERCIVFRFAFYLQNKFKNYFVDCDFNSSSVNGTERYGKQIPDSNGRERGRFVDIIIHKRTFNKLNDFICFEVKKWNNYNKKDFEKDQNNLSRLTSIYGYEYGFHIIFGKKREETKIIIFKDGKIIKK